MKGFADLHCHLLPELDDGARNGEESLAMARMAVADGTDTMVATPHINPGRFDNTPEGIATACRNLQHQLRQEGIPLTLYWAAEARLGPWLLGWLRKGALPLLNQGGDINYLLLEFPLDGIPPGAQQLVELLRLRGITPLLAHPERTRGLGGELHPLAPFLAMGCLCQITAGSLTGQFGERPRTVARMLLERGWAHVMASDGHRFYSRQPVLQDGMKAAARLVGEERALALVTRNPRAVLAGEPLPAA